MVVCCAGLLLTHFGGLNAGFDWGRVALVCAFTVNDALEMTGEKHKKRAGLADLGR